MIVGISTGAIVCFLAVSVYVVFPPPATLLAEAEPARIELYEAIRLNDHDEINRRITQWELSIRKLPNAIRIRHGSVSPEVRDRVTELLCALALTRHFNEHGEYDRARAMPIYLNDRGEACIHAVCQKYGIHLEPH